MVGTEAADIQNEGDGLPGRGPQILCDGKSRWSGALGSQKYTSITPKTNFKLFNAFSDENENLELPGSDWNITFTEQNGTTTVHTSIYNESLERLERMIEYGFKEGTIGQLKNLEEVLATLTAKHGAA
jgi:uncharacterized protein YndB with AHSA1/START domain